MLKVFMLFFFLFSSLVDSVNSIAVRVDRAVSVQRTAALRGKKDIFKHSEYNFSHCFCSKKVSVLLYYFAVSFQYNS